MEYKVIMVSLKTLYTTGLADSSSVNILITDAHVSSDAIKDVLAANGILFTPRVIRDRFDGTATTEYK